MAETDNVSLAERLISECERIEEEMGDNDDACEFARSVKEKAESMLASIEDHNGSATPKMVQALENMLTACSKWQPRG